ncbi:MAG: lipid II:glycine glycyltransferase FemX [Faecousia sp.]
MPIVDQNNAEQMQEYQKFVSSVPDTHFIQDPRWANVHRNLKPEYVVLRENGKIVTAATVYVRPIVLGLSLLYVNRGPVSLEHSLDTVQRVIGEMQPLIRKYRAFAIRFDPNWAYSDEITQSFVDAGFRVRGRGYTKRDLVMSRRSMALYLKGRDMDSLMKMFKGRTRRDINKSLRSELTVEEGSTPEYLDVLMNILEITCRRDKISHKPRAFFERILENFSHDEARVYLIRKNNQWLSASVAVNYAGRMYYYHSGSANEMRNLCPNARMQYELIQWAVESGCHTYDVDGIITEDPSDGLYLFKSGYCNEDPTEEYIGELDYPTNRFLYWCFIQAYSAMQKIRMWWFRRRHAG